MPEMENLKLKTPEPEPLAIEPIDTSRASEVCQMLMEDMPLLESEDRRRYELIYRTLVADRQPKTFLDHILVKDYVDGTAEICNLHCRCNRQ